MELIIAMWQSPYILFKGIIIVWALTLIYSIVSFIQK
jgi:hypothetical protein